MPLVNIGCILLRLPNSLCKFRFKIKIALYFVMNKAPGWRWFPKCSALVDHWIVLGPLISGMLPPWDLTLHKHIEAMDHQLQILELFMDVLGWWMDIYNFPLLMILSCFGPFHKGESMEYPLLRYLNDPTLPHRQVYIAIIQLFCQVDLTWLLSLLCQIPKSTLPGQQCPIAMSASACGLPELASRCPQNFNLWAAQFLIFFFWSAKTSAPKK